jgi:hypothetical protein
MTLAELNILPRYRAEEEFLKCCGSVAWARTMARRRPFASFERLLQAASEIWWRLDETDWKEAFQAHPQIGKQTPAAHSSRLVGARAVWNGDGLIRRGDSARRS